MTSAVTVSPAVALIDVPRHFHLQHFSANERVTLTVTSRQSDGRFWRSESIYLVNADGTVDVSNQAPLLGSYDGIDGQGLLWSQSVVELDSTVQARHPQPPIAGAIVHHVLARDTTGNSAETTFEQHFAAPGLRRRVLNEDGLVGVLYSPAQPGPHPAVIFLNGSGGGVNEERAALFASHGYEALALGYFSAPGLPDYLSSIPLEYFERALNWLQRIAKPTQGFVAVSGHSRGGELALLLASRFPQLVSAAVAYVPSSVVHGVLNAGVPGQGRFSPAWTHNDQPLTHVWESNVAQDWSQVDRQAEPRRQASAFVRAQTDAQAVAKARIPVEKIDGPVMVLSGGDDGYWPSTDYAKEIVSTLRAASHPYPVVHEDYPGAGHALRIPHVPATEISRPHAVSGIVLTSGGTARENAKANEASWLATLGFLQSAVKAHTKAV